MLAKTIGYGKHARIKRETEPAYEVLSVRRQAEKMFAWALVQTLGPKQTHEVMGAYLRIREGKERSYNEHQLGPTFYSETLGVPTDHNEPNHEEDTQMNHKPMNEMIDGMVSTALEIQKKAEETILKCEALRRAEKSATSFSNLSQCHLRRQTQRAEDACGRLNAIGNGDRIPPELVELLCGGFEKETGFSWDAVEYFRLEDGILQSYAGGEILPGPGLRVNVEVLPV